MPGHFLKSYDAVDLDVEYSSAKYGSTTAASKLDKDIFA